MEGIYPSGQDADPLAVPGVDPDADSERGVPLFTLEVDGEIFALSADKFGGTAYTWVSGPNAEYG